MSAAQANRDVAYFTFSNTTLQKSIYDMYIFLKNQNITVGKFFIIIIYYLFI